MSLLSSNFNYFTVAGGYLHVREIIEPNFTLAGL